MIDKRLVLSGCGTVFYLHFGALKRLLLDYKITEVAATSGGAIMAALLAAGYSVSQMETIIKSIDLGALADYSLNPFAGYGLINGNKLLALFKKHLPGTFGNTKIPLVVVVTNLTKGRCEYYSTQNTPTASIAEVLRASIAIPGMFKYHKLGGDICVDGGVTNNFALDLFNDSVDTIGLKTYSQSNEVKPVSSIGDYINTIVNLMIEATEKEHIEDAVHAKIIYLKTPLSSTSFRHTKQDIQNMIDTGFNCANTWLKTKNSL